MYGSGAWLQRWFIADPMTRGSGAIRPPVSPWGTGVCRFSISRRRDASRWFRPARGGGGGAAAAVAPRGPRHLSILDLPQKGRQPMISAGERYVVAFNGEIYNHRALRLDLGKENAAPAWRGHSDTAL